MIRGFLCLWFYFHVSTARLVRNSMKGHIHKSPEVISYERPMPSTSKLLNTNADDYVVNKLPGITSSEFNTKHWAGQLPIPYQNIDHYGIRSLFCKLYFINEQINLGGIFFWLFEPNITDSKFDEDAPLIIWLNGGPV